MFKVESNLVEAFFGNVVLSFRAKIAPVDNRIDKSFWIRSQITARLHPADAFEAKSIPDAAGGDIGFIDQVEDAVSIALEEAGISAS